MSCLGDQSLAKKQAQHEAVALSGSGRAGLFWTWFGMGHTKQWHPCLLEKPTLRPEEAITGMQVILFVLNSL